MAALARGSSGKATGTEPGGCPEGARRGDEDPGKGHPRAGRAGAKGQGAGLSWACPGNTCVATVRQERDSRMGEPGSAQTCRRTLGTVSRIDGHHWRGSRRNEGAEAGTRWLRGCRSPETHVDAVIGWPWEGGWVLVPLWLSLPHLQFSLPLSCLSASSYGLPCQNLNFPRPVLCPVILPCSPSHGPVARE